VFWNEWVRSMSPPTAAFPSVEIALRCGCAFGCDRLRLSVGCQPRPICLASRVRRSELAGARSRDAHGQVPPSTILGRSIHGRSRDAA
jgi:hypothetical protein